MVSPLLIRRLRGPAFLLLFGVTALLNQLGVLGFHQSWPLYLILSGLLSLAERATWSFGNPASPQAYSGMSYPGTSYPGTSYPGTAQPLGDSSPHASLASAYAPPQPLSDSASLEGETSPSQSDREEPHGGR